MQSVKKLIPLIFVIFLIIALSVSLFLVKRNQDFRSQAAPATDITLTSPAGTIRTNEQFNVTANISTGENQVAGAEIYLSYDPDYLQAITAIPGTFLTPAQTHGPLIDDSQGSLFYSIYMPVDELPKTGEGELATFTFRALASGSTTINIGNETVVVAIQENGNNVLDNASGVTVNISTATGSSGATVSPTPTAPGAGSGGGSTTTPTPTLASSATPTPYVYATSSATPLSQVPDDLPVTGVSTPVMIMIGAALALFGFSFALLKF